MAQTGHPLPPPAASTAVAAFLRERPDGARVFFAHRMACVGCALADFDTLADAAQAYGLPLGGFLDDLAAATSPPSTNYSEMTDEHPPRHAR